MGIIQKKDEKEEIDGIQIIERSDTPGDDEEEKIELVEGTSAEHIAAGTTAEEEEAKAAAQMAAGAADENLMPEDSDDDADDDIDDVDEADDDKDGKAAVAAAEGKKKKLFIAGAIALIIIAAIGGYFVGNGGFGSKGAGTAELSKDQLDATVASYTYNGKKTNITAREAIKSQYSLSSVKTDDGKYTAPSADTILSYVRNQILLDDAESRGITVTAKEMKKYAKQTIGISSYKTMASQYGVTKAQAKEIVRQSCVLQKLYKKVTPSTNATAPTAPDEPADEDNQTDDEKKAYAEYIIKLAGKEWDSKKGTWKSTDGTYATALSGEEFTADSATYSQAMTAYYTAYQQYSSKTSKASNKWTDYVNDLYANASIEIYGLFS